MEVNWDMWSVQINLCFQRIYYLNSKYRLFKDSEQLQPLLHGPGSTYVNYFSPTTALRGSLLSPFYCEATWGSDRLELVLGLAPEPKRQDSRTPALNCYSKPTPNTDSYNTRGSHPSGGMHGLWGTQPWRTRGGSPGQIMKILICHTQELSVDFGLGVVRSHWSVLSGE